MPPWGEASPPPPQAPLRILHNLTRLVLAQPESDWAPSTQDGEQSQAQATWLQPCLTLEPDCFQFPNTRNSGTRGSWGPHGALCLEHFPSRETGLTLRHQFSPAPLPGFSWASGRDHPGWPGCVGSCLFPHQPGSSSREGGAGSDTPLTPGPRAGIRMGLLIK